MQIRPSAAYNNPKYSGVIMRNPGFTPRHIESPHLIRAHPYGTYAPKLKVHWCCSNYPNFTPMHPEFTPLCLKRIAMYLQMRINMTNGVFLGGGQSIYIYIYMCGLS